MSRFIYPFLLLIATVLFTQSCAIQKRRYMPGWHVSGKKLNLGKSKTESISQKTLIEKETSEISNELVLVEEIDSLKYQNNSSHIADNVKPIDQHLDYKPILEVKKRIKQSLIKVPKGYHENRIPKAEKEISYREKASNPWGVFGGTLGVLLALLAIPVLFLLIFFFVDDNEDGPFVFELSSEDSVFVNGFKKSYNAVFILAIKILTIILILCIVALLIALLYSEVGLLGTLLIIGLIVVIFLIIYFILEFLVDSILGLF